MPLTSELSNVLEVGARFLRDDNTRSLQVGIVAEHVMTLWSDDHG